mmetsp:Transcript_72737/g.158842  ORF Transcript_72737/g.158842 Transcript_72737/m.158842 type:complete len:98 (-) Transcript_72737:565-858(-)
MQLASYQAFACSSSSSLSLGDHHAVKENDSRACSSSSSSSKSKAKRKSTSSSSSSSFLLPCSSIFVLLCVLPLVTVVPLLSDRLMAHPFLVELEVQV